MKMKRSPKSKSKVFDITETEDKKRQRPKPDQITHLLKEIRHVRKSINSIQTSKTSSVDDHEKLNSQILPLRNEIIQLKETQGELIRHGFLLPPSNTKLPKL
jgi:septal ring factor EnvC (AmiA/AmiB activator)